MGSPPRMRGKRDIYTDAMALNRITPADAGKTAAAIVRQVCKEDHPRGCGENIFARGLDYIFNGSPPRMRGKPAEVSQFSIYDGITPADAGKTTHRGLMTKKFEDHPRGCGENAKTVYILKMQQGSPPRMRGKPADFDAAMDVNGITPADAGKTIVYTVNAAHAWDHPRGCGENLTNSDLQPNMLGSPPRMRGKLGGIKRR